MGQHLLVRIRCHNFFKRIGKIVNDLLNCLILSLFQIWESESMCSVQFSSVTIMSDCLRPHEPQHARPPCPSPTPRVPPNPCPLSQWCHPTISSSVVPFSSCPQSFPASGSFPVSQSFSSGGKSNGVSASKSVLPMTTQDWSPLGWTGWISLQSKGLSRVFSNAGSRPERTGPLHGPKREQRVSLCPATPSCESIDWHLSPSGKKHPGDLSPVFLVLINSSCLKPVFYLMFYSS